jgi:hypothetical protein
MTPTPQTPEDQTPDHQVASFITQGLLAEDLIAQAQISQVLRGLANGTLKTGDWRRIAEHALDLEARHGKTAY